MLSKLKKGEYENALPLFSDQPLTYFPVVARAIIEGNTAGRLWVDNLNKPSTLLMWDEGPCLGLAGNAGDAGLNEELAVLIDREIVPQALAKGNHGFKIYYTDGWEEMVGKVFTNLALQERARSIFTFDTLRITAWRDSIPAGCTVRRIDVELLESSQFVNLDRVREEISCCWTSMDHFLDKGFGFCIICDGKIAGWCTAEYASGTDRGIGIETVAEYQGRGFATLTACAFIEHCMSQGLTPYWDAWKSNLASIVVAEKVGFKRLRDYSIFLGRFDEPLRRIITGREPL